jgi:purine nucleosidase
VSRPILLDTDIGTDVDDAIALALVLASPEFDLRAVSIVSGDVGRRGQIARQLLTLAGRSAVPVTLGVREPVLRQRRFLWLGHEGEAIVPAGAPVPAAAPHAVDALTEYLRAAPTDVVAIGPLSNLAVAIMKEPEVAGWVRHLTVMGGVLGLNPDVPPFEYNLASDPEAALVALSAGIPATLVPADVTWQVALTRRDLERLRKSRSPLLQAVCDAIEVWAPLQQAASAGGLAPDVVAMLHDPLTVASLLEPAWLTWECQRLRPVIDDGLFRLVPDASAPEVRVATAVDAPAAVEFIVERLLRFD